MSKPSRKMPTEATEAELAFDTSYKLLNDSQRRAVDTVEGPVMVIAGPGTGKTTILSLRIANIIRTTDTAPENILALTFTESGAYAMRRKLLDTIGPAAYKVRIHTFHGFAERTIADYPDYFPRIVGSSVITDAEQFKIIENIVTEREIELLRPYGDPLYYVKPILREIHTLKRENVSPERLLETVDEEQSFAQKPKTRAKVSRKAEVEAAALEKRLAKNRELAHVYRRYEEELTTRKQYDFDDMLLELIRAMEGTREFKLTLQETHQYILADEHQDANASQNRILELLADFHDMPNLFIVGDDKQAIYRFQGASLDNFLYFTKKYPEAVVVDLTHNYRSHQLILDASHGLISHNPSIPGRERTKLISLQIGGRPVKIAELGTLDEELTWLAQSIRKLITENEKPEEIAILYRDNSHAAPVSAVLTSHGIPHRIESDHDVLSDVDAGKVLMLTTAIHDPSSDENLARVLLLSELNCDPADVSDIAKISRREKIPLHTLIKSMPAASPVRVAYNRIIAWSRQAETMSFLPFLDLIIRETGIVATIMRAPDALERMSLFEAFHHHIAQAATSRATFYLRDFIDYIAVVRDHKIMTKRPHTEHLAGVRLMTAHRSKGLEFNYVYIIHAIDGIWGNRTKRSLFTLPVIEHARDEGRIEDERRLFYVALTRAREGVYISYSRFDGRKETIGSQFTTEMPPDMVTLDRPLVDIPSRYLTPAPATPILTPPSILDPEFVRSLFLSQPLPVTHLNNFLECPWRYFFMNLIRLPSAENKSQMYGTAVHAALRAFFEAYRNARDMNKKDFVALVKHHLDLLPLSADDRADSWKKGKKALEGYYDTYYPIWNRRIVTEYAVGGVEMEIEENREKKNKNAPLRLQLVGKIDKIEFMNEKDVVVVDYKTGKPKSRNDIEGKTRDSKGNYKRQLAFYKLLLDGDSKKLRMKSGEIDFIEPNDRGIYKKESFEVNEADVAKVREEIESMARDILSLSFIAGKCDEKDCEYCRLGKILMSS